jgi:hypothetical protein
MTRSLDPKDLIQAEIDGLATPDERETLRAWAERDPSVREELREMRGLADLLARVPMVAPPQDLAGGVMRAVRLSKLSSARSPFARFRALWPSGRAVLPFAYAAAAGAAACFLAIRALSGGAVPGSWVPDSAAVGTMMAPSGDPIGRSDLVAPGLHGQALLRKAGGSYVIEISLESPESGEIGVRFDPKETMFVGIAGVSHGLARVEGAEGVLRFSQQADQRVNVLLASRVPHATRVSLELTGGSGRTAQGALEIPGQGD